MRTARYAKTICIAVKPSTRASLKKLSDQQRISISELARPILETYCEAEEQKQKELQEIEEKRRLEAGNSGSADTAGMSLEELVKENNEEVLSDQTNKDML